MQCMVVEEEDPWGHHWTMEKQAVWPFLVGIELVVAVSPAWARRC